MREYRIIWEVELTAESPVEAARAALEIQRDPDSIATVFDVFCVSARTTHRVDLRDIDRAPDGHCPNCGGAHTQECLDGGRCVHCEVSLTPYEPAE